MKIGVYSCLCETKPLCAKPCLKCWLRTINTIAANCINTPKSIFPPLRLGNSSPIGIKRYCLSSNNLLPIFYIYIYIIIIIIIFRACPLATLGVGLRFQVRGRKPWGRKAAKRAYKLAFLPPRPQRLPPLRAFHLRPHAANLLAQSHLSSK